MLSWDAYADWWQENTDEDGELRPLGEPIATLAAHIMALQERIDRLPDPHAADRGETNAWATQCCCVYDHPDAECMSHKALMASGS